MNNKPIKFTNKSPLFALTRKVGSDILYQTIELLIKYGTKINFHRDDYLYRYYGNDSIFQFRNEYDYKIFELLVNNGMNINDANIITKMSETSMLTMLTYKGGGKLISNIELNTKECELWLTNKIINLIDKHTKLAEW
jgi:hypothetical protein